MLSRGLFMGAISALLMSQSSIARECASSARHDTVRERLKEKCDHTDDRLKCIDVIRVKDGDTLAVNVPKVHPYLGKNTGVRLFGVNTPEKKKPKDELSCLPLPRQHTVLDKRDYKNCLEAKRLLECEDKASARATATLKKAVCSRTDRVDIEFVRNKNGDLIRESFGRMLGNVLVFQRKRKSPINVQKILLTKGLAYPYLGGKKPRRDWCKRGEIVKKAELQQSYVRNNFCDKRRCTEKTRMNRCIRKKGLQRRIDCYQERIEEEISTWFGECSRKRRNRRAACYTERTEGYLRFCSMFSDLDDMKRCRDDLNMTIADYCRGVKGANSELCLSSINKQFSIH